MGLINYTCGHKGCQGTLVWKHDNYGSVGGGGSEEVYRCDTCNKLYFFQLPD